MSIFKNFLSESPRKKLGLLVLTSSVALIASESDRIFEIMGQLRSLQSALNEPLYKNEKARCANLDDTQKLNTLGCRNSENTEFMIIGKEILETQDKLTKANTEIQKYVTDNLAELKVHFSKLNKENLKGTLTQLLNDESFNQLDFTPKIFNDRLKKMKKDLFSIIANSKNETDNSEKRFRVFHAKQHACLIGNLKITTKDDRMDEINRNNLNITENDVNLTTRGLFNPENNNNSNYKVIIRLSSGLGVVYPDIIPDVKGFAIKVLEVDDKNILNDKGPHSVDLLMTSGPNPFGNNLRDFADFMQGTVEHINDNPFYPPLGAFKFIQLQKFNQKLPPRIQKVPEKSSINNRKSLAAMQFWSGHPYLLGKTNPGEEDSAMKFNITPFDENGTSDLVNSSGVAATLDSLFHANHLREDLIGRFTKGNTLKYNINMQLERSPETTPIESTVVEWKEEDSPSIKVAELSIPPQIFDNPEIDEICENASFTPAHYHSQNRPLSNMGRGRIVAYRASLLGRLFKRADVKALEDLTEVDWSKIQKLGTVNNSN